VNPNDIFAQQQAMVNQALERSQHLQYEMLALVLVSLLIYAFVIYLFYARLRDIGEELRKFRIAYESAHTTESPSQPRHDHGAESAWPAPTKPLMPSSEDVKYMPKAK
jgi:hypothetical protein